MPLDYERIQVVIGGMGVVRKVIHFISSFTFIIIGRQD